jgi:hypothetical protein
MKKHWFHKSVFNVFLGTEFTFEPDKVSFILSRYIKCSQNRFWSSDNPRTVHVLP